MLVRGHGDGDESATATVERTATTKKASLAELIQRENKRKRTKRLLLVLLLAAIPALAIGIWAIARPKPVPTAARFRAAKVTMGDVVREVHATGRLEAVTTVQVGAEISGRISTVEVDYNDRVKAGQVLARFDRAALEAQLAQINATLAAARAAVEQAKTDRERVASDKERVVRLFASKSVSEMERDNATAAARLMGQRVSAAEAQVAAQQAAYTLAKTNLDHTVIRAPIDGVVITRNVDPGQTVASMLQTPVLFTVAADLRKMHVIAAVDEADIGEVAVEQAATFTVNAYPDAHLRRRRHRGPQLAADRPGRRHLRDRGRGRQRRSRAQARDDGLGAHPHGRPRRPCCASLRRRSSSTRPARSRAPSPACGSLAAARSGACRSSPASPTASSPASRRAS